MNLATILIAIAAFGRAFTPDIVQIITAIKGKTNAQSNSTPKQSPPA